MLDYRPKHRSEAVVHLSGEELSRQFVGPRATDELLHEERRLRHGKHPAEHQRDTDDHDERREQLPGNMGRVIDRQKGQNGDDRGGQQRHGRRGAGTQDRHALAHAPLHVHQCRVGYHDGIVDEHAHCNDDRRERHTLQGDTLHVHHHQRGKNGEDQPAADQNAVLHADEEEQYSNDGYDRDNQIQDKPPVGHGRLVSLVINRFDIEPVGHRLLETPDLVSHRLGHIHYIARRYRSDSYSQCRPAAHTHKASRRCLVTLFHAGDVHQPEMLARSGGDRHLPDVVERVEITCRFDADAVLVRLDRSGVDDLVLSGESTRDIGCRQAAAGHHRRLDRHVDRRRLHAVDLHTRHILDLEQLVFKPFGFVFHFAPCAAVARDAVEDAQHVAEIVVHHRRPRPGRQLRLHVADLTAQFVPQLLHLVGPNLFFDIDRNFRYAGTVLGLQVVEFTQRLNRLFQHVGHLGLHLGGRSPGIGGQHERLLDGKGGILQLPHLRIRE